MYDVIVALDWSKSNMAIARLDKEEERPRVIEREADIEYLKKYLRSIKGSKSITIEETRETHKLFLELVDYVDEVIIVDPYRNKLLLDGPKNDKRDAVNLALLTRNRGLLREVHHSMSANYEIRRIVSGYIDIVESSVRAQNQMKSIKTYNIRKEVEEFLMNKKKEEIEFYERKRKEYEKRFKEIKKNKKEIRLLEEVEGIGLKGAIKIIGMVIDGRRFKNEGQYLSYCGLIKYRRESGGMDYGEKITRYNRILKSVYKTAALAAIEGEGVMREYYEYLTKEKRMYEHNARNAIARLIAKITLKILKTGERYKARYIREKIEERRKELLAENSKASGGEAQ